MGISGRFAASKNAKYSRKKGANKISVLLFAVIFIILTLAIFTSSTFALTVNDIANSLQSIFQPSQTQATTGQIGFMQWLQAVFGIQTVTCNPTTEDCSGGFGTSGTGTSGTGTSGTGTSGTGTSGTGTNYQDCAIFGGTCAASCSSGQQDMRNTFQCGVGGHCCIRSGSGTTCTNQCTQGQKQCTSSLSYQYCQLGTNGCYHWVSTSCPSSTPYCTGQGTCTSTSSGSGSSCTATGTLFTQSYCKDSQSGTVPSQCSGSDSLIFYHCDVTKTSCVSEYHSCATECGASGGGTCQNGACVCTSSTHVPDGTPCTSDSTCGSGSWCKCQSGNPAWCDVYSGYNCPSGAKCYSSGQGSVCTAPSTSCTYSTFTQCDNSCPSSCQGSGSCWNCGTSSSPGSQCDYLSNVQCQTNCAGTCQQVSSNCYKCAIIGTQTCGALGGYDSVNFHSCRQTANCNIGETNLGKSSDCLACCVPSSTSTGQKCSDGTAVGSCSSTKPLDCQNWGLSVGSVLTNNCGKCLCPSGQTCTPSTGLCSGTSISQCAINGGNCKPVCIQGKENDIGTQDCPQSGAAGGTTCCVPSASTNPTSSPPSFPQPTQTCSDGTAIWGCSASKPARCLPSLTGSPSFQDDCNRCGCTSDKYCNIFTAACSPRLSGNENCLTETSTIKKCNTRQGGEYLDTYGKGCTDFGAASDNCPNGHCGYVKFITTQFCQYGCDSAALSCRSSPPTPSPTLSCTNYYQGVCKTVCIQGQENDIGTQDCPQSGAAGGKTCCVPTSVPTPPKIPPSLPPCLSLPNGVCRAASCLNGETPLQGACNTGGQIGGGVCCQANPTKYPGVQCVSGSDVANLGDCLPGKQPQMCEMTQDGPRFAPNSYHCGCPANWNPNYITGECIRSPINQKLSGPAYQYGIPSQDSLTLIVPLGNGKILSSPIVASSNAYTDYNVVSQGTVRVITFVFFPEFQVITNTYDVSPT